MKAEQIKEGLKLCADKEVLCVKCPYEETPKCASVLMKDALDLIEFAEKVIEKNYE